MNEIVAEKIPKSKEKCTSKHKTYLESQVDRPREVLIHNIVVKMSNIQTILKSTSNYDLPKKSYIRTTSSLSSITLKSQESKE